MNSDQSLRDLGAAIRPRDDMLAIGYRSEVMVRSLGADIVRALRCPTRARRVCCRELAALVAQRGEQLPLTGNVYVGMVRKGSNLRA